MRKISACILLVLLASVVPLAITSAAAYEKKIPCDADGDNELTKEELVNLKRKKRGYWKATEEELEKMRRAYLEIEGDIEEGLEMK